jgi:hypothetical protein
VLEALLGGPEPERERARLADEMLRKLMDE